MKVVLKPLEFEDGKLIYKWRNDPSIVKMSSLQKDVTWEEHVKWMKETVQSGDRRAFIINVDTVSCGQIRYDRMEESVWIISVYLVGDFTGKGIGGKAIEVGNTIMMNRQDAREVWAFVRGENEAGLNTFRKSGFTQKFTSRCPKGHISFVKTLLNKDLA